MVRRRRDEEEEEEEEYERRRRRSVFVDDAAVEDNDGDSDEVSGEVDADDDFIVNDGAELPDENEVRHGYRTATSFEVEPDDIDEFEKQLLDRYKNIYDEDDDDDATDEELTYVDRQALLPSVNDPKLWLVKCAIGHEREMAICIIKKFIERPDLQIRSAFALDHLENFIYVEANKESHVTEACRGLRHIYSSTKPTLVPIKEMADVLSVESKTIDLSIGTWVRMKIRIYKGDLANVASVDNVRRKVTIKLIPRIDLHILVNKLEGKSVGKKKMFAPSPRFFNIEKAREMNIPVERRRDKDSGEYFEMIDGLKFKDGFLYKTVSMKSIITQNIQPTYDELDKFHKACNDDDMDLACLSTFATGNKGSFMKGDLVIVVRGELKDLVGRIDKVEEESIHVRPKMSGLPKILNFKGTDLRKYFNPGDHVKVFSGVHEGSTGLVVKIEGRVLVILSDATKEHVCVFADHVAGSSEITNGVTRMGDYELHDLVQLDDISFGVIIQVESEAVQVIKGVPDRPEVVLVKSREIKEKIGRRGSAQDRDNNLISFKDVVRVFEGPYKGKQGCVEHIFKGVLFIYDCRHLENAGFICVKAQSCVLVGGSRQIHGLVNLDKRLDGLISPFQNLQSSARVPSGGPFIDRMLVCGRNGGGRRSDVLIGKSIKIRRGPFKGYLGCVKEVTGSLVRMELDSQLKVVTVKREDISDGAGIATPLSETRYHLGNETPMHRFGTPMRDIGATPVRNEAWDPITPSRQRW